MLLHTGDHVFHLVFPTLCPSGQPEPLGKHHGAAALRLVIGGDGSLRLADLPILISTVRVLAIGQGTRLGVSNWLFTRVIPLDQPLHVGSFRSTDGDCLNVSESPVEPDRSRERGRMF